MHPWATEESTPGSPPRVHRKELTWVSSRGALMGCRREYPCKPYRDAPLENKRKHPWTTKRAPIEALQGCTPSPRREHPCKTEDTSPGSPPGTHPRATEESTPGSPPGVHQREQLWVSSRGVLMGRRREYPWKPFRVAPLGHRREHL